MRRALLSVFHKHGVVELARGLADAGVEILSTGGTARLLRDEGVPITAVSDVTGFFCEGRLVEAGDTATLFTNPTKHETEDYITGRFG